MLEKINDGTKPNFAKRNCSEDHVLLYLFWNLNFTANKLQNLVEDV